MDQEYIIRPVQEQDAALLRDLAGKCPPLDLHTPYTYWVAAALYGEYSFLVYDGKVESPIGYVMCVKNDGMLFVWQIGILEEYRGKGISHLLIKAVFDKAESKSVSALGVTIAKENKNSYYAFRNHCRDHGYSFAPERTVKVTVLDDPDFSEEEIFYSIHKN